MIRWHTSLQTPNRLMIYLRIPLQTTYHFTICIGIPLQIPHHLMIRSNITLQTTNQFTMCLRITLQTYHRIHDMLTYLTKESTYAHVPCYTLLIWLHTAFILYTNSWDDHILHHNTPSHMLTHLAIDRLYVNLCAYILTTGSVLTYAINVYIPSLNLTLSHFISNLQTHHLATLND